MNNTVYVYRNLHKRCWSVMQRGRVIAHLDVLGLDNCQFVVRPAGRKKTIEQRRKNVHAFGKGTLFVPDMEDTLIGSHIHQIGYNPYLSDTFFYTCDKYPLQRVDKAIFLADGRVYGGDKLDVNGCRVTS